MEHDDDPFDITESEHFSDTTLPKNVPEALARSERIH
jgi:hypothetical protein